MTDPSTPPPSPASQPAPQPTSSGAYDEDRAEALIRDWTTPTVPPLVPELTLHLATELTPLWEATEETLQQTGLPPPFWAFCWAGGQALARWVLDNPDAVEGRRVMDFATGCGVAALAAAKAGAERVQGNEIDAYALTALRLNAALNKVRVAPLDGDVIGSVDRAWDVVLAADVLYEKALADRVLPWLQALAATGTRVLLADPGRSYLPGTDEGVSSSGGRLVALATYDVAVPEAIEDRSVRTTTVFALVP
ncbi:MAG: class I SAM-dependent methyltransferase [Rhodospirillaceae bacterium]